MEPREHRDAARLAPADEAAEQAEERRDTRVGAVERARAGVRDHLDHVRSARGGRHPRPAGGARRLAAVVQHERDREEDGGGKGRTDGAAQRLAPRGREARSSHPVKRNRDERRDEDPGVGLPEGAEPLGPAGHDLDGHRQAREQHVVQPDLPEIGQDAERDQQKPGEDGERQPHPPLDLEVLGAEKRAVHDAAAAQAQPGQHGQHHRDPRDDARQRGEARRVHPDRDEPGGQPGHQGRVPAAAHLAPAAHEPEHRERDERRDDRHVTREVETELRRRELAAGDPLHHVREHDDRDAEEGVGAEGVVADRRKRDRDERAVP